MSETDKKKILWAAWVAFTCALIILAAAQAKASEFPNEFHDPALDTINNNLAILDADLNGNFEMLDNHMTNNLPTELIRRGRNDAQTNLNKSARVSGLEADVGTEPPIVTVNSKTNKGAMSESLTQMITGLSNQVGTLPSKGEIYGTNTFGSLTNGEGITLVSPKIFREGGGLGTTIFSMSFGSLGEWAAENETLARTCKWVILGWVLTVYFYRFVDDTKKSATETLNQRQVTGSTQAAAGTNLASVSAIAYAAAVTAAILTACGAVLSMGASSILGDFTDTSGAALGTGGVSTWKSDASDWFWAIPYFKLISAWVPAWNIIVLHMYYLFTRSFLIWPVFQTVRVLIYWLPS